MAIAFHRRAPETRPGRLVRRGIVAVAIKANGEGAEHPLFMADRVAAPPLSIHGHPVTRLPQIERLAESGVVFEAAYTHFPLCAATYA